MKNESYEHFVEKFKPKKTTDDCYTPTNVYTAVADYVAEYYKIEKEHFIRPFWPGADYKKVLYPEGYIVVDNPPFSISAKIIDFYNVHGIKFFLFCPSLTGLQLTKNRETVTFIATCARITYENGATVRTSFITNMEHGTKLRTAPDLLVAIESASNENIVRGNMSKTRNIYPASIMTGLEAGKMCQHGIWLSIKNEECESITALDCQKKMGKGIYGSGLLLSEKVEKKAKKWREEVEKRPVIIRHGYENTYVLTLNEEEKERQKNIGKGEK